MNKIIIVGAGHDQLEAIEVAQSMGIYTICVDRNPNAPGAQVSDEFHNISTLDYDGLIALCREKSVNGITTVASESSIPIIAKVAAAMNLPGISEETALLATNKAKMKDRLIAHDILTPKYAYVSQKSELSEFLAREEGPWVLKPSDSSGQRGIIFSNDQENILKAFEEATKFSTDNIAVVEQYVKGPEINVCGFVKKGKVTVLSIADRVTEHGNFGIAIEHRSPSVANGAQKIELERITQSIADAIQLKNGLIYPQFILSSNGINLIEVAARMPGGNNREMALYLSGVDMVKLAILLALDIPFEMEDVMESSKYKNAQVKFITRNSIPDQVNIVTEIRGVDEALNLPNVKKVFVNLNRGDKIPPLSNSTARFGGVIVAGDDLNALQHDLKSALDKIEIC